MSFAFKQYRRGQRILFATESEYEKASAALKSRGYTTPFHGKNWFPDREEYKFYIWMQNGPSNLPLEAPDLEELRSIVESACITDPRPATESDSTSPFTTAASHIETFVREELHRLESRLNVRMTTVSESVRASANDLEERITLQLRALAGEDDELKAFISAQIDRSRESQLEEDARRLREERDQYWNLAQHEEEQRAGAEARIKELESEVAGLHGQLQKLAIAVDNRTWDFPDRLLPMVQDLADRWPDRISFTDSALDSARMAKLNDGASNFREIKKSLEPSTVDPYGPIRARVLPPGYGPGRSV